jgi:hypothetical protein
MTHAHTSYRLWSRLAPLALALAAAAALRAALWGRIPRTGLISDEGEYLSAATWLADGRGFDWYQGYLWTRVPIYPLFVAGHLRLFGDGQQAWIYLTQTVLSLLNVTLVYLLAAAVSTNVRTRALAALFAGVYLPFAIYAQTLLSETLYITLLLVSMLALLAAARAASRPAGGLALAALAGALLGLATLTRSLTLGFIPLAALWLLAPDACWRCAPALRRARWRGAAAMLLAAAVVLLPWSAYSSRLYGGPVLADTSGAYNLLLGARTAYDSQRSDAQVRDYVLGLLGQPQASPVRDTCASYPGALPTQAARQAAMTREGLCLVAARPLAFLGKSLAELIDLFQINYTGAERFTDGFSTGRLPPWYVLALFVLDDTLYVLALPLAVLGWFLARAALPSARLPFVTLTGLWWLYNLAVAPLLFAINRFRLPLLPLAFIFAAWVLVEGWRAARLPSARLWQALGATLAALLFLVAATPYAYLEQRAADQPSRWASYLGPYPSALDITFKALAARPQFLAGQQFVADMSNGDLEHAEAILARGILGPPLAEVGPALLAGRRGDYAGALALLPDAAAIERDKDVPAGVVRGDLLRSMGETRAALDQLGARYIDDANPVEWAWAWLEPAPATQINVGGSLDLGYISGCYLGEGDPAAGGNFRWCSDGARLRFPGAGAGAPQKLVLRVDGRAWRSYARQPVPPAQVFAGQQLLGTFTPDIDGVREFEFMLPAGAPGADVIVAIRTATFVPDAARYNSQQGRGVVGQVQRLGVRLDQARIEP